MNRIFKVLWNAATGTFIVTSETAKSRGKSGRRKLAVSALVGLSSIMVLQMRWPMQGTIPAAVLRYQAQREAGGLQLVLMPQPILTPTLMAQAPQWVIMPPQWGNGVPPLVHTASPPATLR